MKRIFLSALLCTMGLGFATAQVKYCVKANGLEESKTLYLLNMENQTTLGSTVVKNGEVLFEGEVADSAVAALSYEQNARQPIAMFILDGSPVSLTDGVVDGSALNLRFAEYYKQQDDLRKQAEALLGEYKALYQSLGGKVPAERVQDFQGRYENIAHEDDALTQRLLDENKDNLIPLLTLLYDAEGLGAERVSAYLKEYKYANRPSLQPVRDMLAKEAIKLPGATVVNFSMNDLKDNLVNLTDWVGKGNYVLVDFWASWCGPCRQEMPNVKADYERFHPKGFEIVGVSLDNGKAAWEKAVKDLGVTWPQMSDLKGWKSEGAAIYNIRAIPATILFDPEGKVVACGLRGQALTKKLEEIYE